MDVERRVLGSAADAAARNGVCSRRGSDADSGSESPSSASPADDALLPIVVQRRRPLVPPAARAALLQGLVASADEQGECVSLPATSAATAMRLSPGAAWDRGSGQAEAPRGRGDAAPSAPLADAAGAHDSSLPSSLSALSVAPSVASGASRRLASASHAGPASPGEPPLPAVMAADEDDAGGVTLTFADGMTLRVAPVGDAVQLATPEHGLVEHRLDAGPLPPLVRARLAAGRAYLRALCDASGLSMAEAQHSGSGSDCCASSADGSLVLAGLGDSLQSTGRGLAF
jgi:hypothetical protein